MCIGLIGYSAKDAVRINLNVHVARYQNIDSAKNCRCLNSTVVLNNRIAQIALHASENSGNLSPLKNLIIVIKITPGKSGTAKTGADSAAAPFPPDAGPSFPGS